MTQPSTASKLGAVATEPGLGAGPEPADRVVPLSVCVCTFRRPSLLGELLHSLASQSHQASEVVVVDNDPAASAHATVDAFVRAHPTLLVRYAVEPAPGVSHARNRAVRESRGARLAFIDDDEVAAPDWLAQLGAAMDRYQADVVLGPTRVRLDDPMPDWVRSVNRRLHLDPIRSGQDAPYGAGGTGNVLLRREVLAPRGGTPFDARLTHTGGEDAELFEWIRAGGGRVVWCAEAHTLERLSPERLQAGFYLQRALCFATVHWRSVYRRSSLPRSLGLALTGAGMALAFAVAGAVSWPFGRARAVLLWMYAARGVGRVMALTRFDLNVYGKRRSPGAT